MGKTFRFFDIYHNGSSNLPQPEYISTVSVRNAALIRILTPAVQHLRHACVYITLPDPPGSLQQGQPGQHVQLHGYGCALCEGARRPIAVAIGVTIGVTIAVTIAVTVAIPLSIGLAGPIVLAGARSLRTIDHHEWLRGVRRLSEPEGI